MKIVIRLCLALVLAVIISSCASTETTTFTDPAFRGRQFSNVCVVADISDLKYKQKLEREMGMELSARGISVRTGSMLFPPTRDWSEEQMQEILLKEGIDGYLLIEWKDKQVQETYKPGQAVTETKGEVKKRNGRDIYTERTVTTQGSGTVEREYRSYFEAKLIDVNTKGTAWIATSYSSSGEWFGSDYDLIMESYAEDIAEKLRNDGLIR